MAFAAATSSSFLKSSQLQLLSSFTISTPFLPYSLRFRPPPPRRIVAVFADACPPRPRQTKRVKSSAVAVEENSTEAAFAAADEPAKEGEEDKAAHGDGPHRARRRTKSRAKESSCNGGAVSAPPRARKRAKSRSIGAEEETAPEHLQAEPRAVPVEAEAAEAGREEEVEEEASAAAEALRREEAAQQADQGEEKEVAIGGEGGLGAVALEDDDEGYAREEHEVKVAVEGRGEGANETWLRPRQLFVCNLPRRCDIEQLLELFKPYGTVLSVEVSRDVVTGVSRGCGFVTMRSLAEAKSAVAALDGYDLDGREILVKFSSDIVSGRRNLETVYAKPKKDRVFETPYKIYVGNLSFSVQPQDLRAYFSQCGNVVSTRLLTDRKGGKGRVYAFLTYSSPDEVTVALKLNNSYFHGREIVVREGHIKSDIAGQTF